MLKRAIKPHVVKALDMYPVVILTGSRQVGKSTLAYEFVKEKGFAYVSLDNIDQRKLTISSITSNKTGAYCTSSMISGVSNCCRKYLGSEIASFL